MPDDKGPFGNGKIQLFLDRINIKPSLCHVGLLALLLVAVCHKALTHFIVYPSFRLVFGTLYPAYASYKAVKTKNVKEYVKWMMYWIVFALFTCAETFTDVFLSWLPFYYEIKIIMVIWLLSPATKGSSILYRKFVHPTLCSREQDIDEYINKAKEQSYRQFLDLGSKGVTALMQTAIKNVLVFSSNVFPQSDQVDGGCNQRLYSDDEEMDSESPVVVKGKGKAKSKNPAKRGRKPRKTDDDSD